MDPHHLRIEEDTHTPEELLHLIEAKGRGGGGGLAINQEKEGQ